MRWQDNNISKAFFKKRKSENFQNFIIPIYYFKVKLTIIEKNQNYYQLNKHNTKDLEKILH